METSANLYSSLDLLNAVISLCFPSPGQEGTLGRLGYKVYWLEAPIQGNTGKVVADLVVASSTENHSMLLEAKGGANIDPPQATKYAAVTPDVAWDVLAVETLAPQQHMLDPVVLGNNCYADRLALGLEECKVDLPLLVAHPMQITLHKGRLARVSVDTAFRDGVQVDMRAVAGAFLHFDDTSSEADIAPYVSRCLVNWATQEPTPRSLIEITHSAYGSLFRHIRDQGYQRTIAQRVGDLLRLAAKYELKGLLQRPPRRRWKNESWAWAPNAVPGGVVPQTTLRRIRRQCTAFCQRLLREHSRTNGQLSFKSILDEVDRQ